MPPLNQKVMDGGTPLDAGVARFMLNTPKTKLPKSNVEEALSAREAEILTMLAEGLQKREFAGRLNIRITAVTTYVNHIYQKLHTINVASAIHKAHHLGLFPPGTARQPTAR